MYTKKYVYIKYVSMHVQKSEHLNLSIINFARISRLYVCK